ncbi:MAG: aminotransferase class IV [Actinomycetota bacterium]|nr:aminotransferase class IV [Actinomycetota bacterium]
MSSGSIFRWRDGALEELDYCDMADTRVVVADSWLVVEGRVRGLDLHRRRFLSAISPTMRANLTPEAFWDACIAELPRTGEWFPRVELQLRLHTPLLVFRLRPAPQRARSLRVATYSGPDPRTKPTVKGPDLERLAAVRTSVQPLGADEAVLLSPDGFVIEGAYSAFAWWRGDDLVFPDPALERVDSVTARSLHVLATALGVRVRTEFARPDELEGRELWALSALHGARIVTSWIDGPALAAESGRLDAWRRRLDAIARPLPLPHR